MPKHETSDERKLHPGGFQLKSTVQKPTQPPRAHGTSPRYWPHRQRRSQGKPHHPPLGEGEEVLRLGDVEELKQSQTCPLDARRQDAQTNKGRLSRREKFTLKNQQQ